MHRTKPNTIRRSYRAQCIEDFLGLLRQWNGKASPEAHTYTVSEGNRILNNIIHDDRFLANTRNRAMDLQEEIIMNHVEPAGVEGYEHG